MIKQWIKAEVLFRDKYPNPLRREEEKGLFVDAETAHVLSRARCSHLGCG